MLIGAFAYPSSVTASTPRSRASVGEAAPAPGEDDASLKPTADQTSQTSRSEQAQMRLEQMEIADLAARDRVVRVHEQAHAAVGGALAGSPTYSYTRGPDGRSYVTDGEVSIDTAPVAGDPQATLAKMDQVRRAALAPAEPSAQDMRVAAQAQATAAQARGELAELQSQTGGQGRGSAAASTYRSVEEGAESSESRVDERA